jgi:two-component system phosphate regulon sensor histidine kinase PhoR
MGRMKPTIFFKLFSGFLLVIFTFTCFLLLFSLSTIRNFFLDMLAHDLEKQGETLKLKVIPLLENDGLEELDLFVKKFGTDINTRITVVDREGIVLADSDEDPKVMNNHKFRPEIASALKGETGRSLRFSNTMGADMLYIGLPIERNGQISEVLRVSLYVKDIDRLYAGLRSNILKIIIILTLLSLVGAFFYSRSLTLPIKEIKLSSERIASGDFDTRISLKNRDELKDLADGLNAMTGRIQNLFNELSRQKAELNSILSSIADGLLAINKHGRILFSNKVVQDIFQSEHPDGKFYWEAIRDREFNDFIKDVQQEQKSKTREIKKNGRLFLCRAQYLSSREELVVSVHDLSEMRRLEQIKKDFISNVSHELRTPLTAIKGYIETLKDEGDKKSQRYIDVIDRHTHRLINIVKDLLLLSELEEGEPSLEYERIDLENMINSVLKIFEQKLEQKNLPVHFHIDSGFPPVHGDPFRLEQMFINIIDNAVKYTEKGEIEIFLEKKNEDSVSISIQDSGIGIPQEHLSRIFERFYVVDKSRSRKLGGTGLGLSIVKHIVLLHNGKVNVESMQGKGTTFTVILPIIPSK